MKLTHAAILIALVLPACSEDVTQPARLADVRPASIDVAPGDFAVLPCSGGTGAPCALVVAGGKSLLFGAPAGISSEIEADRLAGLDSAFLFSMLPPDVEGLDEVRNRGWRAGRPEALIVAGPEGTASLLEALNLAFEQPDALSFVEEGAPRGGFDAALLQPGVEVLTGALAFDSGDLKVSGRANSDSYISYRVEYRDLGGDWHELILQPCKAPDAPRATVEDVPVSTNAFACDDAGRWPLDEPFMIAKSGR